MSKAAELAALIGSQSALSNRNLIINGAMQVAQRGTSFSDINNEYLVDRFKHVKNNTDQLVVNASQSSTSPTGFSNSLKISIGTAETTLDADESFVIQQHVEAQNLQHILNGTSEAKSVTMSFWVRSNKTGTYTMALRKPDNTDRNQSKEYTISAADTWEHKSLTFSGDTSGGGINNDNGAGFFCDWWLAGGSNVTGGTMDTWANTATQRLSTNQVNLMDSASNEWYITGVHLEVREQATPFAHRSSGDELARCQRYYYQTVYRGSADTTLLSGTAASGTVAAQCGDSFPVTMRSAPAVGYNGSITAYDATVNNAVTSISANGSSTTNASINVIAGTGLTVGRAVQILSNASDEYLTFAAEL